jgi:CubicO group peptidase (beta-lactamase class C family)
MRSVIAAFAICMATVSLTLGVAAGAPAAVCSAVDAAVRPMLNGPETGVAVGIVQGTTVSFCMYGVERKAGSPVTPDTLFELASVTKVFTSALLGQAVVENRRALSDSMAQYLPGFTFNPAAQKVTLLELATFTAGLPDMPPGLPKSYTQWGLSNYTLADLEENLSAWTPPALPAPYRYSNLSYGLLGYVVSTQNESWLQFVRGRITGPLQMANTVLVPGREQVSRLAQGYGRQGQPVPYFPVTVWMAAGGLKSTARDMVTFAAANMSVALNGITIPHTLQQGMQQAQHPYFALNPERSQALGWVVYTPKQSGARGPLILKNGGHPGFSSAIVLYPAGPIAVVLLANGRGFPATEVALRIIREIPTR